MLIRVGLSGFTGVLSRLKFVSACRVCVMRRFFVLPEIVMLGSLSRDVSRHACCVPMPSYWFGVETLPKDVQWSEWVRMSRRV